MNHIKNEKKLDLQKHDEDEDDDDDDDSDLSNDTPLSELIKQEASAKQQRSQTSTPKDISSTSEQPDEMQTVESMKPEQLDQPVVELDGNEQSALDNTPMVDNSSDLLDNRISEQDVYVESTQNDQPNDFNVGKSPPLSEEKPSKIEISMPIDSFESDSNDEKSMENIKREIEALPELKDSNSSENSQDEKIGIHNTMAFKENASAENADTAIEKLNDNSVGGDRAFDEKFDTETIDLVDTENEAENDIEPADSVQPVDNAEKDEQVESIELADESIDLTESKSDTISEQNKLTEGTEVPHDGVELTEKSESIDGEKVEILDNDECQAENGETVEKQEQEEHKQLEQQQEEQELQQHQQEEEQQQEQLQQHKDEEQLKQKQSDEREEMEEEEEEQQQHKPLEEEEDEEEPSVADSTAAEIVMEISSDDMQEKDDDQPNVEETTDDIKMQADSSQLDTDDCIEIKCDDQKPDPISPLPPRDEKPEKSAEENAETSVKKEQDEQMTVESKRKTPTPKPTERKVSTDDELFEDAKETLEIEVKPTPQPSKRVTPAITCDTDDDSVIEVVKEEKVGVKRDYSRRKKDQSHSEKHNRSTDDTPAPSNDDGGSISSRLRLKERSESPFIDEDTGEPLAKNKRRYSTTPVIDSPNSPASSDDRDYRSWKKSILLLYNSLAGHRCASIFAKPITDEQAPNYSQLILQPMDLTTLKRNIDSGQIRNILDFQLYVMRMCYNAIFYNINDDVICERAKEMLNDALQQIAEFSVTWKKESEKASSVSSSSSHVTKSARGRKSTRLMN